MNIPFYVLLVLTSSIGSPMTVDSIAAFQTKQECELVARVVSRHINLSPQLNESPQFDESFNGIGPTHPVLRLPNLVPAKPSEVICEEVSN
jgi:hypothetical protein